MKDWQLLLTDDEAWWLMEAVVQARIHRERQAAATTDERLRSGWLADAERFQQLYDDLLQPLIDTIAAVREAGEEPAAGGREP